MSVGLLDFFVLEASDYVDRLQRLVAGDEPRGPDSATLLKLARGLRGSAVMARLGSFADAVSGLERGARLLNEGRIAWTPELAIVVAGSITELKALIPMARLWGESQDQRARSAGGRLTAVLDEVERLGALMQTGAGAPAPDVSSSGARVPDARPASEQNPAVRAFFDTIDQAAAAPAVPPKPARMPMPPTTVATRLDDSAPVPAPLRGPSTMPDAPMPIVPIASLAPTGDVDAVIHRAPAPAISFAQRFIADVSPLVGSLRARLAPLRQGAMQEANADMVAAFRPVLLSLRDTAASYEYNDVRAFCDAVMNAQAPLAAAAAGALDTALTVMLQQDLAPHVRAQRLGELRRVVLASSPLSTTAGAGETVAQRGRYTPRNRTPIRAGMAISPTAPPVVPTVARPTPAAPSGRELNSLLSSSLDKVRELEVTPLGLIAIPSPGATASPGGGETEPEVVPIDSLLYRGPRALSRARQIVNQLRTAGDAHDNALIAELFDLVDLAGSAH